MGIARPALESATTQLRLNGPSSLTPKLWTILVVACAMGVTGCARNPVQRDLEVRNPPQRVVRVAAVRVPARAPVHSEERHHAELRARRPDPALLVPQPAPNCEFKRADIKAVDPEEWARLQVEYQRQCYEEAEKAARERLSQLQAYLRN
jgi:hypothetical protein